MSAVSAKPISFPKYKSLILSLNLTSSQLQSKWFTMNHMYNREVESTNNQQVLKFLEKRRTFLAEEAMQTLFKETQEKLINKREAA